MGLGARIKELREARGLSQKELATLLHTSQAYISKLEKDIYDDVQGEALIRLSEIFKLKPRDLYKTGERNTEIPRRSYDDILKELSAAAPIAIPVVASIHAGPSDAIDYAYWARSKDAKNLKALLVQGYCMSPLIEEGDIIIIDPDANPTQGKILVCYNDGEIFLKKYGEHEGCSHVYGVVIGINRRL